MFLLSSLDVGIRITWMNIDEVSSRAQLVLGSHTFNPCSRVVPKKKFLIVSLRDHAVVFFFAFSQS